jgi:transposase
MQRFEAAKSSSLRRDSRFFTPEEDAVVTTMRKAGSSYRVIAKALGRTSSAVETRWNKHLDESNAAVRGYTARTAQLSFGEACHQFTAEEDRRLEHMASSGMQVNDMAVEFGLSANSLYARLQYLQRTKSRAPTQKQANSGVTPKRKNCAWR